MLKNFYPNTVHFRPWLEHNRGPPKWRKKKLCCGFAVSGDHTPSRAGSVQDAAHRTWESERRVR